jgi:hypothetical protein
MEPVKTVEEIKISDDSEKCPPYTKFTYHYKVLEELLNPGGSMVNKEINVFPFNWKTDFEDHKEYYLYPVNLQILILSSHSMVQSNQYPLKMRSLN